MAYAPKHPCGYPGCAALIGAGDSRCEMHRIQEWHEYDQDRKDDPFRRLYASARRRKARKIKLRMNPLCERCQANGRMKPAEEVHHRKAIRDGGDPFDIAAKNTLFLPIFDLFSSHVSAN